MTLREQLALLPSSPGVYLFKDSRGRVIYVGKASNLRSRARAHFTCSGDLSPKEQRMQQQVASIETIVTDSEQQALILECTLIKKHHPRYNVSLRDDKTFPYLRIDLREPWPGVNITRRWRNDGARYFGPFASAGSVRETMGLLKRLFPFRSCNRVITEKGVRPCLEYHMRRCLAPCAGKVSQEEYKKVIEHIIMFLEGRRDMVLKDLTRRMSEASRNLEFERAAWLRDQIRAVESVVEGQRLAAAVRGDLDAIAMAQSGNLADVQVFFIRGSRLVGREHFAVDGVEGESPSQVMTSFVKQYYASAPAVPPLILLQHPIEDGEVIVEWLKDKRGGAVTIRVAKRGARKDLIDVVADNARQSLEVLKLRLDLVGSASSALTELQTRLSLPARPERIECYDISNIQGALAVGSMVVFEGGRPRPSHYRRFRIKTVVGADDCAMLMEVVRRRFRRASMGEGGWTVMPDLVLVDGGKGQLNAVLEAMRQLDVQVPVAGLAKEKEEVFLPGVSEPVVMPLNSPALQLLQRVRDEAHRFAIGYHRRLRGRQSVTSLLDAIPGIGPKRRKALLRRFGSIDGIRTATVDELRTVPGITEELAKRLKTCLSYD
ncbi:MAG: excinuclease ABC subunit UvrC [Dehalococcoidia bacterium]|nr:excinuclease ABC subunit UvrC [Dehalococcoidia bacterium]